MFLFSAQQIPTIVSELNHLRLDSIQTRPIVSLQHVQIVYQATAFEAHAGIPQPLRNFQVDNWAHAARTGDSKSLFTHKFLKEAPKEFVLELLQEMAATPPTDAQDFSSQMIRNKLLQRYRHPRRVVVPHINTDLNRRVIDVEEEYALFVIE